MRWIVGLGNPGKRYESTRHNVGFQVVERFAERHGYGGFQKKFSSLISVRCLDLAGGDRVFIMKPQTYMNASGTAVREALDYFGGKAEEVLVVHDDLDLPLGRLRFRASGSSGGHRGVQSILDHLGTDFFARLKVGIGREEDRDPAEFVLSTIGQREKSILEGSLDRAAESIDVWIAEGTGKASLRYNGPEPKPDQKPTHEGE